MVIRVLNRDSTGKAVKVTDDAQFIILISDGIPAIKPSIYVIVFEVDVIAIEPRDTIEDVALLGAIIMPNHSLRNIILIALDHDHIAWGKRL
jgi:hypothetical protein